MNSVVSVVAASIPAARARDCVLVAIDGADGAGKSTFAVALATELRTSGRPVVQVSVDDFHNPRAVRYRRGRDSAPGFWLDAFDYPLLRRCVLEPLGPGGSRRYCPRGRDLDTDAQLDDAWSWSTAAPGAVAVIDGLFLHRDELVGRWNFSVFLDVPAEVSVRRLAARDGLAADQVQRYVEAQRLYRAACDPLRRATVVIDNSDPARPLIVRSCSAAAR
jgi:uridine kinase